MFIHTKPRYSLSDLSDLLSIGRTKVHAEIKRGRLKTYKDGNRTFSDPPDVDCYLKLCREESEIESQITKSRSEND